MAQAKDIPDQDGGAGLWVKLKRQAPLLVTGLLFIAGAYALYHLLAPLDMKVVLSQIRATPPHLIAAALAATTAGYVALIGYDWSALRYIGKTAPPASAWRVPGLRTWQHDRAQRRLGRCGALPDLFGTGVGCL